MSVPIACSGRDGRNHETGAPFSPTFWQKVARLDLTRGRQSLGHWYVSSGLPAKNAFETVHVLGRRSLRT